MGEDIKQLFDITPGGFFIERDANGIDVYIAQVYFLGAGRSHDKFGRVAGGYRNSVKIVLGRNGMAKLT